jgi:hypothetical protein
MKKAFLLFAVLTTLSLANLTAQCCSGVYDPYFGQAACSVQSAYINGPTSLQVSNNNFYSISTNLACTGMYVQIEGGGCGRTTTGGTCYTQNGGVGFSRSYFPLLIDWTSTGAKKIKFYGYTGPSGSYYPTQLTYFGCLEVTVNPPPACGYAQCYNQSTGSYQYSYTSLSATSTSYLSFSASNVNSFDITSNNSSASSCTNCSSTSVYFGSNTWVSLNVAPVSSTTCSNPQSTTFVFFKSSCSGPWCLLAQPNHPAVSNLTATPMTQEDEGITAIHIVENQPQAKTPDRESIVFPNPASGNLFVNTPPIESTVHIFNMMGQEVFKSDELSANGQQKLDVSNLRGGLYMLSFRDMDNKTFYSQKVILK